MNIQPLNIQLLLLNLHSLSRKEHHKQQQQQQRVSEQYQKNRIFSLEQSEKVSALAAGSEERETQDSSVAIGNSRTALEQQPSKHLYLHYRNFNDPTRGNIIDIQR